MEAPVGHYNLRWAGPGRSAWKTNYAHASHTQKQIMDTHTHKVQCARIRTYARARAHTQHAITTHNTR